MTIAIPSLRAITCTPQWVRNDLWRRARAVPSLDLRFAENKSLVDATTGQNLVTFSRASGATYVDSQGVIRTALDNEPRFDHDPTTGESLGLLVEESRTNLLLRSEDFSTSWPLTNATVSTNAAVAPDGNSTADSLIETNANALHYTQQIVSGVTSGASYLLSVYAKANTRSSIELIDPYALVGRTFNLSNGTTSVNQTGVGAPSSFSIQPVGNGWYRCSIGVTASGTSIALRITISNGSATAYTGDGTSGVFIWGAQLEAGAFPTSYIKTEASAVTRAADVASIAGTNFSSWHRQDEGTMFAEGAVAQPASGGNQFFFRFSDSGYNNSVALNVVPTGFASLAIAAGGVFDGITASSPALSSNTTSKFAGAYATNNLGLSLNGATAITDATATIPTAQTRADISSDHAGVNRVKAGTIRRLAFWPQRLPNSTLQAITQ